MKRKDISSMTDGQLIKYHASLCNRVEAIMLKANGKEGVAMLWDLVEAERAMTELESN